MPDNLACLPVCIWRRTMYHEACLAVALAEMHKSDSAGTPLHLSGNFTEDSIPVPYRITICKNLKVIMRVSVFMVSFFNPDTLDIKRMFG